VLTAWRLPTAATSCIIRHAQCRLSFWALAPLTYVCFMQSVNVIIYNRGHKKIFFLQVTYWSSCWCTANTGWRVFLDAMISLLTKRLRDRTLSAVDLYAKTLSDIENKSDLNAFVHVTRDGDQRAAESHKRLQDGTCLSILNIMTRSITNYLLVHGSMVITLLTIGIIQLLQVYYRNRKLLN